MINDKNLAYTNYSRAEELSGGELRYLEIKLILFCSAKYILLDEPFNGISPVCCESVRELIQKASQSKGIIMTDHNFREIHKIANRILLLDQGALKEIKEKSELISYGYYN